MSQLTEKAAVALIKGNSLFVDQNFEEALQAYNDAVSNAPNNADALTKRSAVHLKLKNFTGSFFLLFFH